MNQEPNAEIHSARSWTRGSVSWNLGSLTAVHGSSLSEACHVFLGFHGGFMCRCGWLSHWPLATESTSDPVPSLEIGGGTESFRPPTTWLAPAGNQSPLFGGVQKSPYYITKDLPNQHLGNSKVFRTCEPEMGRGANTYFYQIIISLLQCVFLSCFHREDVRRSLTSSL